MSCLCVLKYLFRKLWCACRSLTLITIVHLLCDAFLATIANYYIIFKKNIGSWVSRCQRNVILSLSRILVVYLLICLGLFGVYSVQRFFVILSLTQHLVKMSVYKNITHSTHCGYLNEYYLIFFYSGDIYNGYIWLHHTFVSLSFRTIQTCVQLLSDIKK